MFAKKTLLPDKTEVCHQQKMAIILNILVLALA